MALLANVYIIDSQHKSDMGITFLFIIDVVRIFDAVAVSQKVE